jgi:hypothetical protein
VTTGSGAGSNSAAIVSNRSGAFGIIARVGDAAPTSSGAPSGTDLYRTLSTSGIAFNNAGHVAFSSSLRNAGGTQTATGALFTDASGTLKMVARVGEPLPTIYSASGAALSEFSGVTWGVSYNSLVMNDADTLVFVPTGLGNTGATNNTGAMISMDSTGRMTKIIRNGDVAIPGGSPTGSDAFFLSVGNVALNASGQIAFTASLTGSGVSVGLGNGSTIYGWDRLLGLTLLARTGDEFEVAPGDMRVVTAIGGLANSGGHDGRARSLNDAGVVAFELEFSDGTAGIFTATVPASGVLPALAGAGLLAGRRRRK